MLNKFVIFCAGAIVGSVATWKFVETKYRRIADEEIQSVKEMYRRKKDTNMKNKAPDIDEEAVNDSIRQAMKIAEKEGYFSTDDKKPGKEEKSMEIGKPYIIPPEEFGECDYDTNSLTYYTDGVLTDEYDEVIEDAELLVGNDYMNHFGEYEDDSVFVRNDELESDYEILADFGPFSDVDG